MVRVVVLIAAGMAVAGAFYAGWTLRPQEPAGYTAQKAEEHPLLNPSVTANLNKHFIINVIPLRNTLAAIRDKYPYKSYVYFAYLNNDSWIGLDEKELFTAASTIKVPLAMAVLKSVEERRLSLDTQYILTDDDLDSNFGTLYKRGEGTTLTVNELIEVMLKESDNTAMQALMHVLRDIGIEDPFGDVYSFMGWDSFTSFGQEPTYFDINLKTLANMFLALYNAKYISLEHSQMILDTLDNANFDEQIAAGIPTNTPFAHKTGVQSESNVYSDCGIVYAPQRNYLLCIGSSGAAKPVADKFMAEISKAVYDYVINN